MGRPKKENTLTKEDIIEAAIAAIEKDGVSALGVNRVARELGIKPPAIYKHLDGNTELKKAVALTINRRFYGYLRQKTFELRDRPREYLKAAARASREYVKLHPRLYRVMMQFQLQPEDPESLLIIKEYQNLFKIGLASPDLSESKLIDMMRTINAAIVGFIALEQSGLLTLSRSVDASFEVMLDALLVALEHIQTN